MTRYCPIKDILNKYLRFHVNHIQNWHLQKKSYLGTNLLGSAYKYTFLDSRILIYSYTIVFILIILLFNLKIRNSSIATYTHFQMDGLA